MLGLAVTSYRWIETPLRKGNWFGKRWKTLLIGGGVLVTLSGGLVALSKPLKGRLFAGDKRLVLQISKLSDLSNSSFKGSNWSIQDCVFSSDTDVGKKIDVNQCTLNSHLRSIKTLLIIGNSQSVAQLRMYEEVASKGYRVILTSGWGCHVSRRLKTQNTVSKPCDYYQESVIPQLINNLKQGDAVAIISDFSTFSSSNNPDLVGFDQGDNDILFEGMQISNKKRLAVFSDDVDALARDLGSRGVSLIIQNMGPLTRKLPEALQCINLFPWDAKECNYQPKSEHLRARDYFSATLSQVKIKNKNVSIFDPFDLLCDQDACSYLSRGGVVLFRDSAHVSDEASKMLGTKFADHLQ